MVTIDKVRNILCIFSFTVYNNSIYTQPMIIIFIRNGIRQELLFYLVTEILFAMAYKYAIDRTTTIFHILLNGFLCPRLRKHECYQ